MFLKIRVALIVACLVIANGVNAQAADNEVLDSAVEWLVSQQDPSGAWKSRHYGSMKQGAALTSLALYSISFAPESVRAPYQANITQAFEFLEKGTPTRKRVANPDGSLDHPVYSTSMYLVSAHRLERKIDNELLGSLLQFLVSSQCTEARGFQPTNPNYGGWDVIGPDVQPGKTSGTNVSATRFVLEAFDQFVPRQGDAIVKLDKSIIDAVQTSRSRAATWLKRIQSMNQDGGFRFSAQPGSALNKSNTEDGEVLSYGTATCDGWLGFRIAGLADSENSKSAHDWLKNNVTTTNVPGFPKGKFNSTWPEAIKFYYFQSLAQVVQASDDATWSAKIGGELQIMIESLQKPDGRFENETALMREDDPIIATSFAVIALSQTR